MRKMSMMSLLAAVPLSMCIAQTNGVVVTLTMPGEEMLLLEMTPFSVSVSNGTDRVIPVFKDGDTALLRQIWLDVGARKPYAANWPPAIERRNKIWSFVNTSTESLNPGESFTWTFTFIPVLKLTGFAYHAQATNITAKVLVGDNEWATSATIPFSVCQEDIEGAGLLPKSPVVECLYATTKMKTDIIIRDVKIGNKRYLFTDDGYRIYEIPDGDTPEVLLDVGKGILSVSFKNSKRRVLYNLSQKKGETTEH